MRKRSQQYLIRRFHTCGTLFTFAMDSYRIAFMCTFLINSLVFCTDSDTFVVKHFRYSGITSLKCDCSQLPVDVSRLYSVILEKRASHVSKTHVVASMHPDGKSNIHYEFIK